MTASPPATPWRDAVARFVQLNPHAGAHRVAARAGISVLVPLVLLQLAGRPSWTIYAAFGAFTALYGRNRLHLSRIRMQSTLALLLTIAVTAGVLVATSPYRSWISIPLAALLATIAAVWSDAQDWHPPGPLFVVFAFAACASIPSSPADVGIAAAVAGASAAFAVVVGSTGWVRRPLPRPPEVRRPVRELLATGRVGRHAIRYGTGVVLAGGLATAIGIGHPYWAMVSAVVPMAAPTLVGQLVRGAHRLAGTLIGLGLSVVLLAAAPNGLVLILIIVALQIAAELFVGRNYGLALVFVTPLALLLGEIAVRHPTGQLLLDRGIETLLGVAVAVLVTVATRERSDYPARS
jgi:hypothetical protein